MSDNTDKTKARTIAVLGGEDYEAQHLDGTTEQVTIGQLTTRYAIKELLPVMGDEPAIVELVCNRPEGWADTLTRESYNYIAEAAVRLNRPTLEDYLGRTRQTTDWMASIMIPIQKALATVSNSGSLSPIAR